MSELPRKLYLLTYRAMDGSLKRAWFGSREDAVKAADQLKVEYDILEAII